MFLESAKFRQPRAAHYKKRADLRRVFSQRRGGSDRPHVAPAVKFTAGDFNVATLRGGGKIYAVAPLEPPLRVGAVDRESQFTNYLPEKQNGYSLPMNRNSLPCITRFTTKVSQLTTTHKV